MRAVVDIGTEYIVLIFDYGGQSIIKTIPTTISFTSGMPLVGGTFEGEDKIIPELQVKHIFDYIASPKNHWTFYEKKYCLNDFISEISEQIIMLTNGFTFDEVVIVEPDYFAHYDNKALNDMVERLIQCKKYILIKRSEIISKYCSYPSVGTKSIMVEFTHHSTNFIYNVNDKNEYLIECRYINAENWRAYMRDYALEILHKKTGRSKRFISSRIDENELEEFITNLQRNRHIKHHHFESIAADFDTSIDECFSGSPIHEMISAKIKQLTSKFDFDDTIPVYVYGDEPLRPGIKETILRSIPNRKVEVFYIQEHEHDSNEQYLFIAKAAWEAGFNDQ